MTAPFFELTPGEWPALASALGVGLVFGWFLERGGLGNARKLAAQFYLTDFTVMKVMFSAIITAMLGLFWLAWAGLLDLSRVYIPETFIAPQLVGGLLFGVGFILAGLCPGTACVAAATGRRDGLTAVAGLLVGVFLFAEIASAGRSFLESTFRGALTLPEALHLPHGAVVFAIVASALTAFGVAERIEQRARAARR